MKAFLLLLAFLLTTVHPVRAAVVLSAELDIATLPYEVGICLTSSGQTIWRFDGTPDGLDFPEWMARRCFGQSFSHNHPGEGRCVALSVDDVRFAAWYHLHEIRAVSAEGGQLSLVVIRNPHWVTYAQYNRVFDSLSSLPWCERSGAAWQALGFQFERASG